MEIIDEIDKVNYCFDLEPEIKETTDISDIELTDTMKSDEIKNTTIENSTIKICMAKNCKKCRLYDEYFCEICQLDNYIVNNITGACVEKIETVPSITWKDIFRLEMNSQKEINGKTISGPKLNLRGVTNSQINTGHAFIIYLIFKLKQPLNIRYLEGDKEDKIRIKTICEINEGVSENKNDTNIVEYECIGDATNTNLTGYVLDDIDVGNDSSNLEELKSSKNLMELENSWPTIEFSMDEIKNQTSKNYNFNFTINGKIDYANNFTDKVILKELKMNEIKKSSNCSFKIGKNRNANLNCELNTKEYKNIKSLTFNETKIEYEEGNEKYNISFTNLNKVYLINEAKLQVRETKKSKNNVGLIIGLIIGGIIIVIASVLVSVFCFRRKRIFGEEFQNDNSKSTISINSNN